MRRARREQATDGSDGRIPDWEFRRLNGWWQDNAPVGLDDSAWRVARWDLHARQKLEIDRAKWLAATGRLDATELQMLRDPHHAERPCPMPWRDHAAEILAATNPTTRRKSR